MVGIDGGFVRDWEDKQNHFEVVVGKSMPEDRDDRYFGFVQSHDAKPRRRLFEVLRRAGPADEPGASPSSPTAATTCASSPSCMSPCAEHILDWFHIAMRLTVLGQYAKGLAHHDPEEADDAETQLEKIKW